MSANLDLILGSLDRVKRTGRGYMACCPAHDDKSPSLSIKEADDGRVLVYCFGGCKTRAVMQAIGMDMRDLFADSLTPEQRSRWERERDDERRQYLEVLLSIAGNPEVDLSADDLVVMDSARAELDALTTPGLLTEEYVGRFSNLPTETVPLAICGEWLRERSYSIIHSRAGAGKTATVADLVHSIATGTPWLDMPTVRPAGPLLWVNGDMPRWQVHERLGFLDGLCDLWHVRFDNLLRRSGFVRDVCRRYGLVVFDNRGCLFDLDDANSAEAWRALNDLMRQIADSGCAVILITHAGKGETASAFGSSAQEWFTDSVISIQSRTEDGQQMQRISWDKCRLSRTPAPIDYHLEVISNRLAAVTGADMAAVVDTYRSDAEGQIMAAVMMAASRNEPLTERSIRDLFRVKVGPICVHEKDGRSLVKQLLDSGRLILRGKDLYVWNEVNGR